MVLTGKEFRDLGVSFSPVRFLGGKLGKEDYEARRDRTTKVELNELLASPEYSQWVKKSAHASATTWQELGIFSLALLVVVLLFTQPLKVAQAPASNDQSSSALPSSSWQQTVPFQDEALRLAQEEANSVSDQLQQREAQLLQQLDRNAYLELSLWTAEHAISSNVPGNSNGDGAWINATSVTKTYSQGVTVEKARPSGFNPALLLGTLAATSCILYAAHYLRARRIARATEAHAQQLKRTLDSALEAQRQAESTVKTIQASMDEKSSELRAVNTAKHIAETQVTDLQLRILALQQRARQGAAESATPGRAYGLADGTIMDLEGLQGSQPISELQEEHRAMAEELEALQQAVAERDSELLALNEELAQLTDRLPAEVAEKEAAVKQVRQWLDQAQGQLQNTQTALNAKEKQCCSLETQLEQQKAVAATLQEALDAAAAREAALAKEQEATQGEMKARVASVMDLMKTTRLSLSQKLMQSQSTCEALAQELQDHLAARAFEESQQSDGLEGVISKPVALRETHAPRAEGSLAKRGTDVAIGSTSSQENLDPKMTRSSKQSHMKLLPGQHRSPYWVAKST